MTKTTLSIRELAPAKVNLYLNVFNRMPSGYHELDSLVVFIDIFDKIDLSLSEFPSLEISGFFGSSLKENNVKENIVFRAVTAVKDASGVKISFSVKLMKNLPVAAGLGGGSADAAAVIRAASRIIGINYEKQREIAVSLGADVLACLESKTLRMEGYGEKVSLQPELFSIPVVLVCPPVSVSTKDVFSSFVLIKNQKKIDSYIPMFRNIQSFIKFLSSQTNDLLLSAETFAPEIKEVLHLLNNQSGCLLARMSGSGPACFGIFSDSTSASNAVKSITSLMPNWWAQSGKTINLGENR